MSNYLISDFLFPLERVISLLSGADLHHIFHIIRENLSVSDIACVKSLPGCLYYILHLLHLDATIVIYMALLRSAAHDLRDGHSDDAQVRKRIRALLCLDMAAL